VFIGSLPIHYLSVTQDMKCGCQTPGTVFNFEPIIQEIDSLERLQIELEKNIRKCTTSATTEYNSINQKSEIKPSKCSKN
jgi:hypothetical protein